MIQAEELHAAEVDKMLRKPGELAPFRLARLKVKCGWTRAPA